MWSVPFSAGASVLLHRHRHYNSKPVAPCRCRGTSQCRSRPIALMPVSGGSFCGLPNPIFSPAIAGAAV
ncbi:tsl0224 [Thermosynechococcus vestitus BP-1]|uniref:Tsl0224 protein n=1 Tax=Thermosynechococcus vestitus (strain NIES-2133 / IAM M-273 / BP-1) TaxID=197221 RepID=Q8DM97_THEVB|nr:tsl0224 [Thermosynechococcus vestitus BP-1]